MNTNPFCKCRCGKDARPARKTCTTCAAIDTAKVKRQPSYQFARADAQGRREARRKGRDAEFESIRQRALRTDDLTRNNHALCSLAIELCDLMDWLGTGTDHDKANSEEASYRKRINTFRTP